MRFNHNGYIGLTVISFLIVLSMIMYPWPPPKLESSNCFVGEPPEGDEGLLLPAVTDTGAPSTEMAEFALIRKNVPVPDSMDIFKAPSDDEIDDAHLVSVGERPEKPGFEAFYPVDQGGGEVRVETSTGKSLNLFLNREKMVFMRDSNPANIKEARIPGGGVIKMYSVDVYQERVILNDPAKEYKTEQLFVCPQDPQFQLAEQDGKKVIVPEQEHSVGKDQLQLEWFLFGDSGYWAIHCKPAVYLYPQRKQLVNVKVFPKGELSYTDPVYNPDTGWTVWAEPQGYLSLMSNQSIPNGYLYYESKILDAEIEKPTQGWVVRKSELENLFNEKLPLLGLNQKEEADFKDYWLSKLPESPYFFVGLIERDQRDYLERLDVTPNPDTSIRFSFYFEPLDQFKIVDAPVINTPSRSGFTLVDWGGMIKLHKDTPFTCSQ